MPHARPVRASWLFAALAAASLSASAYAAEPGTPRACVTGEASIIVHVRGFKTAAGMVRTQLYGPDPATFLAKGQWSARIEKQQDGAKDLRFCFPIAKPGRYAIAVRHDANGNSKSDWNDGGGFSRDPGLSVFNMKPKFDEVAVEVNTSPVEVDIDMQYRQGLSIKPWRP